MQEILVTFITYNDFKDWRIKMRLISIKYIPTDKFDYPYHLFQSFESLSFNKQVTILVGDNGTGKSTLLKAIASAAQMISIGFSKNKNESLNEKFEEFSKSLKLTWKVKTRNGFYLTAEDFIGYIKQLSEMKNEAQTNLNQINIEYKNKSLYAKQLASMPHERSLAELKHLYNEGLEYRSHGESYLDFFNSRFKPDGLYILDEPEVALSPIKQLSLISMIKEMTKENAQFIIATHSPILMAIPDAEIISLDSNPPIIKSYHELEHVQLTKDFLNNPERYLRHL